jgi:hypothetical protein
MSLINNKNLLVDSNEEESENDSKGPAIDFFNHVNQLNIHSKKHLDVETFRKLNFFNPKDSNLIDNNEEDIKFINPLSSPYAGSPAFKYRCVNPVTPLERLKG